MSMSTVNMSHCVQKPIAPTGAIDAISWIPPLPSISAAAAPPENKSKFTSVPGTITAITWSFLFGCVLVCLWVCGWAHRTRACAARSQISGYVWAGQPDVQLHGCHPLTPSRSYTRHCDTLSLFLLSNYEQFCQCTVAKLAVAAPHARPPAHPHTRTAAHCHIHAHTGWVQLRTILPYSLALPRPTNIRCGLHILYANEIPVSSRPVAFGTPSGVNGINRFGRTYRTAAAVASARCFS